MPSPLSTILNLPPRTRIYLGLGFLAWGTAGLLLSDTTEEVLGLKAGEEDKEALGSVIPRFVVVEKEGGKEGGK